MKDIKPFQLIFLGACVFIGIIGMLIFSFAGGKPDKNKVSGPTVIIWGTQDAKAINDAMATANTSDVVTLNAEYVQKDAATFNNDLLDALAEGKGPDAVLLPVSDILSYKSKISSIPLTTITERDFKDAFIQEAELYRVQDGYMALPFIIDPLVMYWNRDIFTANNLSQAPTTWTDLVGLIPKLSNVSTDLTVNRSALAMGEYRNINSAKDILSALMFQSGSPILQLSTVDGQNKKIDNLVSNFGNESTSNGQSPIRSALSFYTQFANSQSTVYTWNRSLPNAQSFFAADKVAMYMGYGSEVSTLRALNPNLNFDMALFPQPASSALPITYGKMYGLSVLASSKNKTGAYNALKVITSAKVLGAYAAATGLPPVRRDLLANPPSDSYSALLYKSALYSRGWLDPQSENTSSIFQDMIESQLAGRDDIDTIIQKAGNQLEVLINQFNQKQRAN